MGTLGGATIGGSIEKFGFGGNFLGRGYQIGGLFGGIARCEIGSEAAGKLVEPVGFGLGYAATGNFDKALMTCKLLEPWLEELAAGI